MPIPTTPTVHPLWRGRFIRYLENGNAYVRVNSRGGLPAAYEAEVAVAGTLTEDQVVYIQQEAVRGGEWVVVGAAVSGSGPTPGGGDTMAPGTMLIYPGGTAPQNWHTCDGSAVSRTTYSDLFAVLGTLYGAGNGTTTFNLPDLLSWIIKLV